MEFTDENPNIESIFTFLNHIKNFQVNVFLTNGICLMGYIVNFNVYSPNNTNSLLVPYIIMEPLKVDVNDPFPYQLINLNNVVTIQKTKI
jgi:hypothetical protein